MRNNPGPRAGATRARVLVNFRINRRTVIHRVIYARSGGPAGMGNLLPHIRHSSRDNARILCAR